MLTVSGQAPITLTQAQIDGKFLTFEYPRPADGGSIEVKATLTDKAGNVSPEGQDSAVMGDTTATAAPTVVITEDTDNDGTIDRTEISGTVGVQVTLPAGAVAGDVLTVSGQAPITLTQAQIDGKFLTFEYPRPADGGSIEVKATLTDKAGNVSPEGQDSAVMGDTTATAAPTVVITEDTDNDGTIDRTEISGTVGVQVTLPAGAVAGDVLTVSGQAPITLTQAQIDGKFLTFEYPRPADGGSIEVKATLTDKAGNVSPEGQDSAVMGDTTATAAPTVVITEDTDNDGTIDRTEISGTVGVQVTLPAGAVAGDVLTVSGQAPITLTQAQIDGKFLTFEYPRPADGGSIEVKATLTDKAGNVSPEGQDSAVMGDTTATAAPTVVITEDTDNDGTIDRTEISGTVGVQVTLPAGAVAGDVLTVSGQAPITLTQAQIDGKFLTFEYPRPADGGSIEVKATLTDKAATSRRKARTAR
ncbi:hypothetical protein [Aeromonas caviae]|uniref:hypothetical protein n=1 Tax=Aeromonas caviae TaxID=648 RepID=UPI0013E8A829|nr:hypothetical protein [Aeromonas caviae]